MAARIRCFSGGGVSLFKERLIYGPNWIYLHQETSGKIMSPKNLVDKAFTVTKGAGSLVLLPLKLTAFVAGVGVSMAVVYLFGSGVVAYISAQDSTELAEELGQELHSFSEELLGVPLYENSIEENYQGGAFTALTAGSAQTQNIVNSGVNNQCLEIIDDAASHAAMRFAALDEHLMPDAEGGGGAQEMLAASDGSAAAASGAFIKSVHRHKYRL